jgi:integrase
MRRAGLMKPGKKGKPIPKFTFHDLRHGAATLMVQKAKMNVVQGSRP